MTATLNDGALPFLTHVHRACDALWSELETALEDEDAEAIGRLWPRFDAAVRRHLAMEEEVIFPALEQAMGRHGFGPVQMMKIEHTQMRALLDRMARAALDTQWQEMMDEGDTLLMLVGQHNAKEEGILYPMLQQELASTWGGLVEQLDRY